MKTYDRGFSACSCHVLKLLLIYSFKILIVFLMEKWGKLNDNWLWGKIQEPWQRAFPCANISHISVYLLFKANIFLCVNLVHYNVRVSLLAQDFSNEYDDLNLMIRVLLLKEI